MSWLLAQPEAKTVYKDFAMKNGDKLFKSLIESINPETKTEKDYAKFVKNLHYYIFNLARVYGNIELDNSIAPVTPVCPIPPTTEQENIIDGIYGPDIDLKKDNFLNNYRNRSSHLLDEDIINEEEELLLNDLYFQNSYGDLNVTNDVINENVNENICDNFLNEE